MSSLSCMPVEVLAIVTAQIEAEDIAYMWFCGDERLNTRMRHGGVKSFVVNNPLTFPRLVTHFRGLKSLQLSIDNASRRHQQIIPGMDLTEVAPGLDALKLHFPTALAKIILIDSLAARFPTLTSLDISAELVPNSFSAFALCRSLPQTLLHLSLPDCVCLKLSALFSMPCRLLSLKVHVEDLCESEQVQFRESPVFERLQILTFLGGPAPWPSTIPPSVTDYTWGDTVVNHSDPVTAEDLQLLLPRHLRALSVSWWPDDVSLLKYLPPDLTSLKFTYLYYLEGNLTDEFAQYLPPNLTELITPSITLGPDVPANRLLKKLKKCPPYRVTHPPNIDLTLALQIQSILLVNAIGGDIHYYDKDKGEFYLPHSVKTLLMLWKAEELQGLTVPLIQKLPPDLTRLDIENLPCFRPSLLPTLPDTLTALSLHLRSWELFEDEDWVWAWPTQLRILEWSSEKDLGPCFWDSLGQLPLQRVEINLPTFSNMPSTLRFLPRTLTSARLSAEKLVALVDAFLADLPPSLLSLTLSNFATQHLTPSCCLHLPKTLRYLSIRAWHEVGNASRRNLSFGTSPERMPQLWKLLDQLPRHLEIDVGIPFPDFIQWHKKRRVDDFLEECPNLPFRPHNAGSLRPNNTPHRQKP